MTPVSPTKVRSGAFGGTVGQESLNWSATAKLKGDPAVPLIKKTDLTKSTHGHSGSSGRENLARSRTGGVKRRPGHVRITLRADSDKVERRADNYGMAI